MFALSILDQENYSLPFATVAGSTYAEVLRQLIRAIEEEHSDDEVILLGTVPPLTNMGFMELIPLEVHFTGYSKTLQITPAVLYLEEART